MDYTNLIGRIMIWVVDVYSTSCYWEYELIPADMQIWQDLENGNYSQYLTLGIL